MFLQTNKTKGEWEEKGGATWEGSFRVAGVSYQLPGVSEQWIYIEKRAKSNDRPSRVVNSNYRTNVLFVKGLFEDECNVSDEGFSTNERKDSRKRETPRKENKKSGCKTALENARGEVSDGGMTPSQPPPFQRTEMGRSRNWNLSISIR